jgi:hypothetical protein
MFAVHFIMMVWQQNNEILSGDGQNKFVARARGDFSSLQFFRIPDFLRVCLPCAKQKRMIFCILRRVSATAFASYSADGRPAVSLVVSGNSTPTIPHMFS